MTDKSPLEIIFGNPQQAQAPQPPLHEAQVMELRAIYERYTGPQRFKPGDLVTAFGNSPLGKGGEPYMVIEVIEKPAPRFTQANVDDSVSSGYGVRLDMCVCGWHTGHYCMHWVESWHFRHYTMPADQKVN